MAKPQGDIIRLIQSKNPGHPFRMNKAAANPSFHAVDLGASSAIHRAVLHGHNISSGATVKLQGSPYPIAYGIDITATHGHVVFPDTAAWRNPFSGVSAGTLRWRGYIRSVGVDGSDGDILTKSNFDASLATSYQLGTRNLVAGEVDLLFMRDFTTTDGKWTSATKIAVPGWYDILITYDDTSAANNPTMTVNGAAVALTVTQTPVGTAVSDASRDLTVGRNGTLLLISADAIHGGVTLTKAGVVVFNAEFPEGTGATTASDGADTGTLGGSAAWSADDYRALSETISWRAGTMHRDLTTANKQFRYFRVYTTGDAGNPDGSIRINHGRFAAY